MDGRMMIAYLIVLGNVLLALFSLDNEIGNGCAAPVPNAGPFKLLPFFLGGSGLVAIGRPCVALLPGSVVLVFRELCTDR